MLKIPHPPPQGATHVVVSWCWRPAKHQHQQQTIQMVLGSGLMVCGIPIKLISGLCWGARETWWGFQLVSFPCKPPTKQGTLKRQTQICLAFFRFPRTWRYPAALEISCASQARQVNDPLRLKTDSYWPSLENLESRICVFFAVTTDIAVDSIKNRLFLQKAPLRHVQGNRVRQQDAFVSRKNALRELVVYAQHDKIQENHLHAKV